MNIPGKLKVPSFPNNVKPYSKVIQKKVILYSYVTAFTDWSCGFWWRIFVNNFTITYNQLEDIFTWNKYIGFNEIMLYLLYFVRKICSNHVWLYTLPDANDVCDSMI